MGMFFQEILPITEFPGSNFCYQQFKLVAKFKQMGFSGGKFATVNFEPCKVLCSNSLLLLSNGPKCINWT